MVDLRGPFLRAKAEFRLYDLTDTHWTDRAALVACQEILQRVSAPLPGSWQFVEGQFEWRRVLTEGGNLARLLALQDTLLEEKEILVPKSRPQGLQATLVVFGDSFGTSTTLRTLLELAFARAVFVQAFPIGFDPAVIEREKPGIVLQVDSEAHLLSLQVGASLSPL